MVINGEFRVNGAGEAVT